MRSKQKAIRRTEAGIPDHASCRAARDRGDDLGGRRAGLLLQIERGGSGDMWCRHSRTLIVVNPVSLPAYADVMPPPGANTSRQEPIFE